MCDYIGQHPLQSYIFMEKFGNRDMRFQTMDRKNDDVPYKCRVCSKSFPKLRELKDHMEIHEGAKPFECPVCHKGYSVGSYLKTHMLSHRKLYRCEICGHRVCTIYELNDHLGEHIVQELFECDICKEKFIDRDDMKWHIIAHRCDERPFKCRICSEEFRRLKELKDHMHVHPGVKPFECQFCKKGYVMQGSLTIHEQLHVKAAQKKFRKAPLEKQLYFECNICKKRFRYERTLIVHKIAHARASEFAKSDMYPRENNYFNAVKNEIHDPLDTSNFSYEIQIDNIKTEIKEEVI
ncbi:zinc finger protein 45-like [Belonocnema kinseyi]|uniref:zinc finger protein 45-like n=1 Tax=Belonocnema kinseyi TaxID=2817044 RepID=UPI00143DEACD|nr:zinc finger protein 45-like [Belonocnema kinseyi]